MEYLALAVHDILLEIKCYLIGGAEILQSLRNNIFCLLCYSEKIVDADFACKDNGSVVGQIDVLCPEILCAYADNLDKLSEGNIKFQLFSQIKIRAAVAYGFWLRDQQISNFQNSLFLIYPICPTWWKICVSTNQRDSILTASITGKNSTPQRYKNK